jgi:Ulp1 family protease
MDGHPPVYHTPSQTSIVSNFSPPSYFKVFTLRPMPSSIPPTSWHPPVTLPMLRSSHPLDIVCTQSDLSKLSSICSHNLSTIILHLANCISDQLTVREMRALVSHDSPVNQQIINLYLQLLSHQLGTTVLDTGFFSLLKDHGWSTVQSWFALQTPRLRPRSNSRPLLTGENTISIPCHIGNSHWVAVT